VHWIYHSVATVLLLAVLQVLLGGVFKPWSEHWETIWPLVLCVSLVLLLPKFVFDSFQVSNRFAGPVMRMRQSLRTGPRAGLTSRSIPAQRLLGGAVPRAKRRRRANHVCQSC